MKALSAFKGYRGFYEFRKNGSIYATIYRDGYKYEAIGEFSVPKESDVVYAFREAVQRIIKGKDRETYPDLVDQTRPRETRLITDNSDFNKLLDIPKNKEQKPVKDIDKELCSHTFDDGSSLHLFERNKNTFKYELEGRSSKQNIIFIESFEAEKLALESFEVHIKSVPSYKRKRGIKNVR